MPKRILFLCTGNSCRSQIAEGLWRELAGSEWKAHSAGSRPAGFVHPLALEVMAERGIELEDARSKSVDDFLGEPLDLVVTVCDGAREACPVLPGARMLHWPFDDPAEAQGSPDEQRETFSRVRDEIEAAIRAQLLRESGGTR